MSGPAHGCPCRQPPALLPGPGGWPERHGGGLGRQAGCPAPPAAGLGHPFAHERQPLGCTPAEAEERLLKYGRNELQEKSTPK